MEFFRRLFDTDFMPHGHCYFWKPAVLWTNLLGDAVIALSYFAIPFLLVRFLKQRPDIKFRSVFIGFAAFILACGATHVNDVISIWHPIYRFEGLVKVITALISAGTVVTLAYLFPKIKDIPTPEQWSEAKKSASINERRFKLLVENAPVGVAITSSDGKFLEVNEAMCRMFKHEAEEFYKLSFREVTHPDDMNVSVKMKDSLANGKSSTMQLEKRYLRKDGTHFWALVNATHIPEEHCNLVHILDITDRKQLEQQMEDDNRLLNDQLRERNTELRDTNMDMENFIYAVTHDLRVPLHNLKGLSEVLEEEFAGQQGQDETATAAQMIGENAARMDNLITDLLIFSRTSRQEMNKTEFELRPIIEAAFEEHSAFYKDKKISFTLGELPMAFGDSGALTQVCHNLIANALKFSSKKDELRLEITGETKGGMAIYCFKDNGIGIEPKYFNKLFMPFQRLHLNDDYEGTGIGLATSYRIVQKHGGEMWVESQPGEGSRFYFSLPCNRTDTTL